MELLRSSKSTIRKQNKFLRDEKLWSLQEAQKPEQRQISKR
jgi:hypothetical protein